MKTAYRFRFAPESKYQSYVPGSPSPPPGKQLQFGSSIKQPSEQERKPGSRSKFGCKECRLRRVKCDERFPVCLRCQHRGSLCLPATPTRQWQVEMPWMITRSVEDPWPGVVKPDKRLLHYWLQNTSRMMTVSPDNNPLSFPLLEHLLSTPSLVYAVQSVSAGQETFFQRSGLPTCLVERGLAIQALQRELQNPAQIKPSSILSVFLLGISWSWTEGRPHCYGKEHLSGARAPLEKLLADEQRREDPLVQYILGWYLYWDMSCAFIADPDELYPLNTAGLLAAVRAMRASFHPMIGYSAELFYLLASLGRYCRQTMKSGVSDLTLETTYEGQLIAWKPAGGDKTLVDMSHAYRNHGLIMLYKLRERPYLPETAMEFWEQSTDYSRTTRSLTRSLALESLQKLFETPVDAPCIHFHSIPLLTAGAELSQDDTKLRIDVINRFAALYSANRLAVNLWAIDLLEELWELRNSGIIISWLELLLSKNWTLCFA